MAHLGQEVSKKIRSAIKAKLMELGAYVDDELPDYIMVMVGNKKNKEQMESDLMLFLNKNTEVFVTWLLGVLKKLDRVVSEPKKKKKEEKKKDERKKKPPGTPKKKSVSPKIKSKVGAVVSNDSDGEYDPEKMLRKSILASSVKVPERRKGAEANKNLVLKAVAEADQSIKKRKAQDNLRDQSLEGVLTSKKKTPLDGSREIKEEIIKKKRILPSETSEDTATAKKKSEDLRDRLQRRRRQREESDGRVPTKVGEEDNRRIRRLASPPEDDISKMRENALKSMKRKSQNEDKESRNISVVLSTSKDSCPVVRAKRVRKPSTSSNYSSSSLSSEEEKSETKETRTKFIVTLEGINSRYFKKNKSSEPETPKVKQASQPQKLEKSNEAAPKNETPIPLSVKHAEKRDAPVEKKKPEAKVAPLPQIEKSDKPKRKRITAPEPSSGPPEKPSLLPPSFPPPTLTTNRTVCKYWPRCARGTHCFYFHPSNLSGSTSLINKFSWTAASLPP